MKEIKFEDVTPNPEHLIKSIAEQGYSLETALADLIDNSISANANRIEIITKTTEEPFTLFLADNGNGMNLKDLKKSMEFPSNSIEENRDENDLGRFGLGMKTASFSQTRKFTVISREKGTRKFAGRTWDVNYLKKCDKWRLLLNDDDEINNIISIYKRHSKDHLNQFDNFEANTIIVWEGLYKFEDFLEESVRKDAVNRQITEVTNDHLSLVFHRFMERKANPVKIRINNRILSPFNPFPTQEPDFRSIEYRQRRFGKDNIKIEGFVLPARSIEESQGFASIWTTRSRGLMDMEGIYVYRSNRIILFGGWNGLIRKASRLQLARLRVEVGNGVDNLLHLNVAKSQISIPHDLKEAFESYVEELKEEAIKEYYNRGIKRSSDKKDCAITQLFERIPSNRGILLEINKDFPVLKELYDELSKNQRSYMNVFVRMVNTQINKIRHYHEDTPFVGIEEKDGTSLNDIINAVRVSLDGGMTKKQIKNIVLPSFGYSINSLPIEIRERLK